MAFEHDQFARFVAAPPSPGGRHCRQSSVVHPQKPSVLARPPRHCAVPKMDRRAASGSRRRRMALVVVVTLKLALLCGWLLHELIVNFDESQCVRQLAAASPPTFVPNAFSSTNGTKIEQNSMDIRRRKEPNAVVVGVQMPPNVAGGQNQMPSPTRDSTTTIGESHGTDAKKELVPKRRRKVILRRKLSRKGATANGIIAAKGGAVRRVVWRVVPLKRLPPEVADSVWQHAESAGDERRFDTFPFDNEFSAVPSTEGTKLGIADGGQSAVGGPVRTKTGTVVVRRPAAAVERGEGRRRMARRRTTAPIEGNSAADKAASEALSDWLPISSNHYHSVQQSTAEANIWHRLASLISAAFCLFRAVFDCWALLQCFCCALFLFGLYLRRPQLLLVPIAVDVLSIVLAVLFGLSLAVFMLVLSLLAHSVPPPPLSLVRCALFTVSIGIGAILYALCVFCEQSEWEEMTKRRRRQRRRKSKEEADKGEDEADIGEEEADNGGIKRNMEEH